MPAINIAIDGYSSCGKSTLAKGMAAKLGYVYIDTGAMYRAVTLYYIRQNLNEPNKIIEFLSEINVAFRYNLKTRKSETFLNGENIEREIRENPEVADLVSKISAIKEVRKKLVTIQKESIREKGVIMDGRDIGTVVIPDAELKIFLTASKEVRAKRRFDELKAKGMNITLEEVEKNIELRDYEDTHRARDPLRKADDAVVLDNSNLNTEQQLEIALTLAKEKIKEKI